MTVSILHVVASDQRRGAEVFASQLIRSLSSLDATQSVALLRTTGGPAVTFTAPTVTVGNGHRSRVRAAAHAGAELRAAVRRFRPTVVQAHGGEALKTATAARLGVPIVYRRIGEAPPWILHGPRRWVWGAMIRRAAAVVTVAEALRVETIELFGVSPARVRTIPNAVDPGALRPRAPRDEVRRALGLPTDGLVTISVGALAWEKNPLGVFDVVAPLLEGRDDRAHVFVGEGPLREALHARIDGSSVRGSVLVLGSRDDVGDLLHASDVLVFGSRPHGMEGMPAILLEAGICGLPVVAHRTAGVSEVVEDGVTGFLVPPGDVTAVRSRLSALLEDADLRETMGAAARERCAPFDIHVVAERYLRLYDEVAGR